MARAKKFDRDEVVKALRNKGLNEAKITEVINELTGETPTPAPQRSRGSGASTEAKPSFSL
jgi:mRNA-degrading endonuclease YafQ of YafQ-DinJ toxin-antitoxin module